jgi:hypothetical protein
MNQSIKKDPKTATRILQHWKEKQKEEPRRVQEAKEH